ncbi:MAG: N-methyl-L-tryptophan oxidase [Planctomycetaceae bacterium]|nr:N-methyl-L-tryptophan oxidase [Planctomycetaceae bacterium]|tara:strand:- start:7588 stop:8712 length:1125 start_codon:yes stop_codon:yes gene_type:complete
MQLFDVIVIGCGAIGSAAFQAFASAGLRVLGIDRYQPPHCKGSSHGQSRIIRKAYFEHPDYVPLLQRAYRGWMELELQADEKLIHQVGLLQVGPIDGSVIPGVLASAAEHQLPIERIASGEIEKRFPGFRAGNELVGLFEEQAGYLLVEESIRAFIRSAQRAGGILHIDPEPARWRVDGAGVRVISGSREFLADRLVLATGGWSGRLIATCGVQLQIVRKHVHWFANESTRYRSGSPVFYFETRNGDFYGFPQLDSRGIKVANHRGGEPVYDPDLLDRSVDSQDRTEIELFLRDHLPDISTRATDHQVCMYTRSPDEHFVVDRHPQYSQVALVAGLSGHGFKFAPVLAEAASDLVFGRTCSLPIDFLSLERFRC